MTLISSRDLETPVVISCFLLFYQEPYLSPHHFLLGPARIVLLSAGTQPYLEGQKSSGRLWEHGQQEGNTAGKLKIKRDIKTVRRVAAWLQERPVGAAIELKHGAEGERNTGLNNRRLAVRNSLGQSLSLLVICGGHCCSCVVFPNVCPARLTFSLLCLHLGGND